MRTIVVIPAHNEEQTVSLAVSEARKYADEVIVIDDGSQDATGLRASGAGANVLRHAINRGQGAALRTGIRAALMRGADIIVTFDADLQQDASDIPSLIAPIAGGIAEVALGSRFIGSAVSMPAGRKILLHLAVFFTRLTTGLKITDTHNGFRSFSRRAASRIKITQDRFAHASEILSEISRLNLAYREVPVTVNYSPYSLGKGQRSGGAIKIMLDLIRGDLFR